MGKLLALVIGLAAVAFAAKFALTGTMRGDPEGPSQAKRQLDQVRSKAKELERIQQKAADDIAAQAGQVR